MAANWLIDKYLNSYYETISQFTKSCFNNDEVSMINIFAPQAKLSLSLISIMTCVFIFSHEDGLSESEMRDTRGKSPMACKKPVSCTEAVFVNNPSGYTCDGLLNGSACVKCSFDGMVTAYIGEQAGSDCPGGFQYDFNQPLLDCGVKYIGNCVNQTCCNLRPPIDPENPANKCSVTIMIPQ